VVEFDRTWDCGVIKASSLSGASALPLPCWQTCTPRPQGRLMRRWRTRPLAEIVVTAEKTIGELERVPASITAFTSKTLDLQASRRFKT